MQARSSAPKAYFLIKGIAILLLAFSAGFSCKAQTTTVAPPATAEHGAPIIVPIDANASKVAVKVPAIVTRQAAAVPAIAQPRSADNKPSGEKANAPQVVPVAEPKKPSVN